MALPACPGPIRWFGAIGLLLVAVSAQAQLGGNAASVAADASAFSTNASRTTVGTLDRWEFKTGNTTVREYIGPAGVVFAVTFNGGPTPNLDQLLGSYTAAFNANVSHDRRSAQVNTATLRARLRGTPGSITGFVWLPELMPPGIDSGALQ